MNGVDAVVEEIIEKAIKNFDGKFELDNAFENLISFGELVDRLSVINYKLFVLKDEVIKRQDAIKWVHESEKIEAERACHEFQSFASVEDVRLCKERSRLKRCIDEKLTAMISKVLQGDMTGGLNPEVKKYGNNLQIQEENRAKVIQSTLEIVKKEELMKSALEFNPEVS